MENLYSYRRMSNCPNRNYSINSDININTNHGRRVNSAEVSSVNVL